MIKISKITLGIVGGLLSLYTISCYDLTKSEKKSANPISIHKLYEDKKCEQCHDKAKSYEWKSDFCLTCHDKKSYELSKKYKHKPAVENCTSCHDPHKSEFKYLLKKEAKTLCLECHETRIRDNKIHSKLEKTCTECHTPHASEYELLLKKGGV